MAENHNHLAQQPPRNAYVIDPESAAEMGRLLHQGAALTQAMGGLLPEYSIDEIMSMRTVLDVACGPGEWAIALAQHYPHLQIIGFDASRIMVAYANNQAQVLGLKNVEFRVMDAKERHWDLPPESFDLVNARLIIGFMLKDDWQPFINECMRVTRPGGWTRMTEGESTLSTSCAIEQSMTYFIQVMQRAGRMLIERSPGATSLVLVPFLRRMLARSGAQAVALHPHILDYSYGTPTHDAWVQTSISSLELMLPFLVKNGFAHQEVLEALIEEMKLDEQSPDFQAWYCFFTVRGKKPVVA